MRRLVSSRLAASFVFVLLLGSSLPALAFPPAKPYDPRPLMAEVEKRVTTDKYTFLVLGDCRAHKSFKVVVDRAATLGGDFAILTGDQVNNGTEAEYDALEGEMAAFANKIPAWPCYGNHDARNPANYHRFFGMAEKHYCFDFRNARFIGLEVMGTTDRVDKAELAWFEKQLAEGKKAGKLLFVWQHGPAYTVGSKTEVSNKPNEFTKLCDKYGVVADFAGHDHIYYRTKRGEVCYIVQGLGGAPIYEIKRKGEAVPGDVWCGGLDRKSWTLHNAAGDKTLTSPFFLITAITVDGAKVTGKTVTHDGEVIDEFVLRDGK